MDVYCELDETGTGWTVLMRRRSFNVDFNLTWSDYAKGFGDMVRNSKLIWSNNIIVMTKSATQWFTLILATPGS